MSFCAAPSSNFSAPLIKSASLKEMFVLFQDAWESVKIPPNWLMDRDYTKGLEDKITRRFAARIKSSKRGKQTPYSIHVREDEFDENGELLGIIDIRLVFNNDEYRCFVFECKLLNKTDHNKKWKSLAGSYVEEGMARFVTGQYSSQMSAGGMIGYVLDGNLGKATEKVQEAIQNRRKLLGMADNTSFNPSSLLKKSNVHESQHCRKDGSSFVIHHIFLPVSSS